MATRLRSNHLLISALAKRQHSKNPLQAGFTLVELLIVVIIIGILAAVALPGFLNQADKAKASAAKATAASIAKECQLYLVEQSGNFEPKTATSGDITVGGTECPGTFTATLSNDKGAATIVVDADGTITSKTGTGVVSETW